MADKPDTGAEGGSGGAAQHGAAVESPSNEALLAELEGEGGGKPAAAKSAKVAPADKKPPAKEKAAEDEAPEPGAEDDDDDLDVEDDEEDAGDTEDEEDDLDDEDREDEEDEEPAEADPALAKRIAAVRKMEQRTRAKLTAERAAFDREREELRAQSKQVAEAQQRFDRLAARVRFDSYSVLKELGVTDDDMEVHSQHLFARSKNAAVTPAHRAAADRALRDREQAEELRKTREEVDELKKGLTSREQQAAAQRELDAYFDRTVRKATDATPRVKALIAKSPKRARAELAATALELTQRLGGAMPKPTQLLAAHEKKIARQLRRYGIADAAAEPAASAGAKSPAVKKPAVNGKPTAKPVAGAKPSRDTSDSESHHPSRDELLKELSEGAHLT